MDDCTYFHCGENQRLKTDVKQLLSTNGYNMECGINNGHNTQYVLII